MSDHTSVAQPSTTKPTTTKARKARRRELLSVGADPKTVKGEAFGFLTGILYLAPAMLSGRNMCSHATDGCREVCLNTSGKGALSSVQTARIAKTHAFTADLSGFMETLAADIDALERKAARLSMRPLGRLNGTSDTPWENIPVRGKRNIMAAFPRVTFYDYTKNPARMRRFLAARNWPSNYVLTFSRSECNQADALAVLRAGGNVAIPFSTRKGAALPASWFGFPVVDGDVSDARPDDSRGVVIGLRAKGKAKHDTSGFVVRVTCATCDAPIRPEDGARDCDACLDARDDAVWAAEEAAEEAAREAEGPEPDPYDAWLDRVSSLRGAA